MRVKFRVSLGSRDAEKHSLNFRECEQGMECDVSDAAGEWLVRKGIASEIATPKQKSVHVAEMPEVRAVPDPPSISEPESPEIKAENKPARGAAKTSNTSRKDDQ